MSNSIVGINAGSLVKRQNRHLPGGQRRALSLSGQIEGIGGAPRLEIADDKGELVENRVLTVQGFDQGAATRDPILSVGFGSSYQAGCS